MLVLAFALGFVERTRRLLGRAGGGDIRSAGAFDDFDDRQIQLAPGEIDLYDTGVDDIADADFGAGALAADDAAALVDIPPVVHEVFVADQAIDEVGLELDEDAEVGDARDDAVEFIALSPDFPRSLRFCVRELDTAMHRISGNPEGTYGSPAERRLGRLRALFDFTSIDEIALPGVRVFASNVRRELELLSHDIEHSYFPRLAAAAVGA